ncbi:MAG: aminotransferase class V-fold PLP-dependent enzyme [Bacteroidetes bacterium]|nr:aminotransferase class V-fold PLP-dependent enzyme [Bacteroidota bacterium]
MTSLDIPFIRQQFPGLNTNWAHFDNAGGSQVALQVADRLTDYLLNTNVQLGASYETSVISGERIVESQRKMAKYLNAGSPEEIMLGPSTTMLLQNLSRSMENTLQPGDEVIITDSDHEANVGPWINLAKKGIKVKTWKINQQNFRLELDELGKLMSPKTKLVAFPYASNILGTINPVKEITGFVHERGAKVCVDAVAFAPHRQIDVTDLNVDYLVFSFYKVYGPHYSLLYGKKSHFKELPGINHFFIGEDDIPYKLQPGNVNYELSYSLLGVMDYLEGVYKHHWDEEASFSKKMKAVFALFAEQEEKLARLLLDFLSTKKNVKIIGETSSSKNIRVPTVSFLVDGVKSSAIPIEVDKHKLAIRYGDFYARRLIESLGLLEQDGVIRVSMVHYNTIEEVKALIKVLDHIL